MRKLPWPRWTRPHQARPEYAHTRSNRFGLAGRRHDERLFNSINKGRNKMPAFRKLLSENEIDALITYVRRLRR